MQQNSLSSLNQDVTINPFSHFSCTFKAGSQGDGIKSKITITQSEELNQLSDDIQDKLYHIALRSFLHESYTRYRRPEKEHREEDLSSYIEFILKFLMSLDEKRQIN